MKRALLISLAASLCLAACGGQNDLQLKARKMKEGQQQTKPEDKGIGVVNAPVDADVRKMHASENARRNVLMGPSAGLQTTFFCTDDLIKSIKEKERIKLFGQSQVMFRQNADYPSPDSDDNKLKPNNDTLAKPIVSLSCMAKDDKKPEENKNVKVMALEVDKTVEVSGRFSAQRADSEFKSLIGCTTQAQMADAEKVLLRKDQESRVDILMAAPSKVLFEITNKDDDSSEKKYILLSCDQAPSTKQ